jgi:hypothetical protein
VSCVVMFETTILEASCVAYCVSVGTADDEAVEDINSTPALVFYVRLLMGVCIVRLILQSRAGCFSRDPCSNV